MIPGRGLATDTLAVVLAGGKGTRLGSLTRHVCKPALPFGAAYRNIDFTLSNCVNSGIRRIGIATQHKPESLLEHVDEVWSGVATGPGQFVDAWPADVHAPADGYRGTADAVYCNLDSIRRHEPALVLVLAGDHVYKMDYRPMLEYHRRCGADVTVGCVEVEPHEASQFGILSVDRHWRIDRFVEKPKRIDELPENDRVLASMGIYVFDTPFLSRVLRRDAYSSASRHDFGGDILPQLLDEARVHAYAFAGDGRAGYWRDVGTPGAYWRAHMELLDDSAGLRLDDPRWPLPASLAKPTLTARYAGPGTERTSDRSLIADGCEIAGAVRRSVVFSNVQVSSGAVIEHSVVLPGAAVGRNCRLSGVIVDSHCRIPDGMVIDSMSRRDGGIEHEEPAVITTDDLAPGRAYSYG